MRSLANILSAGLLTRFTAGDVDELLVGELWRLEWISMVLTESPSSAPRAAGLDQEERRRRRVIHPPSYRVPDVSVPLLSAYASSSTPDSWRDTTSWATSLRRRL